MDSIDYSNPVVAEPRSVAAGVSREYIEHALRQGPTADLVEWTGWHICSSLGLGKADHDEICQDLRADLARRAESYVPERSPWIAFVRLVLTHRATVLFRQYARARSEWLRTDLLGTPELQSFLLSDIDPAGATHDPTRQIDRQFDIRETISILPPPLPKVCRLIQVGHTVAEISRILSVPRSQVRSWMQTIQRKFVDRNLDKYL